FSSRSLPLRRTRSTAVMIMPGVQKPHCRPWFSRNASCIGCSLSPVARLSIVRTSASAAVSARMVQDFTALPLMCTTQAPHCEVSQPTWVPVNRRFSRRNCTSSVRGSTSALTGLPFTIILTAGIGLLPGFDANGLIFGFAAGPGEIHGLNRGVFARFLGSEQDGVSTRGPSGSRRIAACGSPHAGGKASPSRHGGGELGEEIVRHLLGRAGDQALAELGELAADLRLDVIGEQRAAVLVGERHHGAALGKARNAALAFAGDLVAVG